MPPLVLERMELVTERMESGVSQVLMVEVSLRMSSSVRIPVDFESRLILEGAMLSMSVSMLSSDCARRRFVSTTAGRSRYIGRLLSK